MSVSRLVDEKIKKIEDERKSDVYHSMIREDLQQLVCKKVGHNKLWVFEPIEGYWKITNYNNKHSLPAINITQSDNEITVTEIKTSTTPAKIYCKITLIDDLDFRTFQQMLSDSIINMFYEGS